MCDGDSPDADIDRNANNWDRHGYGDVRNHANTLANTFWHSFSDRGNTCRRDFNVDVNPDKHADANCNSDDRNSNTITIGGSPRKFGSYSSGYFLSAPPGAEPPGSLIN